MDRGVSELSTKVKILLTSRTKYKTCDQVVFDGPLIVSSSKLQLKLICRWSDVERETALVIALGDE